MRIASTGALLLLIILLPNSAMAQATQPQDRRADSLLLIQSELSHLEGSDLPISLHVDKASPRDTLSRIEKEVRFSIEVAGELPRRPLLTASFDDTPVEEVLKWFAKNTDVVYKAERATKLIVIVRQGAR